nr:50S ribosomal protein L18-like isoform X4 [Ipomoea batatas]
MVVLKRYVLRLFISLKYITANVVDRNNGRIVATASSVEQSLKNSFECGRTCNAKAAAAVGEVLAMRLKVDGLDQGGGSGIHVNVNKEVEKKGFKNRTKKLLLTEYFTSVGEKFKPIICENLKCKRTPMKWRDTGNEVDCGVYLMRHMESYVGESVTKEDYGLTRGVDCNFRCSFALYEGAVHS